MASDDSQPPTTVAAFLKLHELEKYVEAFDEEGWDSLPQLQGIDEAGLMQLISDTKMKSGHAVRLRKALGMQATYSAPVEPPTDKQTGSPAATPTADGNNGAHEAATGTLTATAAHVYAKLSEQTMRGVLVHGTIIETWGDPVTKQPKLAFAADGKGFYCAVCPPPQHSEDGKRDAGRYFNNVWKHMGSKMHWKNFRLRVHGLQYDEGAWLKYTLGNQHGPERTKVCLLTYLLTYLYLPYLLTYLLTSLLTYRPGM
jgi:hypothetical protein